MSLVTVQHKSSKQTQQIDPSALPFFTGPDHDYELVPEVEPPARNASTDVWVAFATEHGGMTEETARALGRDGLVDHFSPVQGENTEEGN